MHERLMWAIEEEDILIWDEWEEGDGRNNCSIYQRPLKKVLEELLADKRLKGHQHFNLRQNMIRQVIGFWEVMPMVLCRSNWPSCALDLTRSSLDCAVH